MHALSTSWYGHRHSEIQPMFNECLLVGFSGLELAHAAPKGLWDGFQYFIDAGFIRIPSLDVAELQELPLPTLIDGSKNDREEAIKHVIEALFLGQKLGSQRVILDLGNSTMEPITPRLAKLIEEGGQYGREYCELKQKGVTRREALGAKALDLMRKALIHLTPWVKETGVGLALRTGATYESYPSEREISTLLQEFPRSLVGYWHDFARCQAKSNLAFLNHETWLRSVAGDVVGCHLNDCKWPQTMGMIPFQGAIGFDRLVPFLPKEIPKVWRVDSRRKSVDLSAALTRWKELWGD